MKIIKTLMASAVAVALVASPVMAQETPAAGVATNGATWASMPIGAHVMIGGFIFVVTVSGLVLLDDDDNDSSSSPSTPATSTSTTTT